MQKNETQIELDAVLNTLVDGVIIIDVQGQVRLFNPSSERIFGYTSQEVVGQNVSMLMPEPAKAKHTGYIDAYRQGGQRKVIGIGRDVTGKRKDGTIFHMHLSVGETKLGGETVFVGTVHDLSYRHQQQEKYDLLQQQHFHLSRVAAMNEMGTAIAHELNQPMAATMNYLEAGNFMIAQGQLTDVDKFKTILDGAIGQTKRASDIIARLRKFIKTGDVEKRSTHLKPVLGAAIDLAFIAFKHSAITFVFEVEDALPEVLINTVQVQQVVVNLVKNACEAMIEGDRTTQSNVQKKLRVTAKLMQMDKAVEICVADTGKGLNDADQKNLFVPFSTEKTDGMGVGLSISRSIIDNHGGKIWATPNTPHGSRFYFTLPISDGAK